VLKARAWTASMRFPASVSTATTDTVAFSALKKSRRNLRASALLTPFLHVAIPNHPPPHLDRKAREPVLARALLVLAVRRLEQPLRPRVSVPPVEAPRKRIVPPLVIRLCEILNQHLAPRLVVALRQPLRVQIPNHRASVHEVAEVEVVVVVVRVSEVCPWIVETGVTHDALPGVVVE
jgi:hypothetical protein